MAGNTVNIDLKLQDQTGSIKARTTDAKVLNKELEKTQSLATGTKTGAAAAANARPSSAYAKAAEAPMENRAYTTAHGIAGTGASSRDFAAQSQGLGGLVRLYATYAANLFAVSTAFNALSNAMATTGMVEGLNQLGVASGRSLGQLSKQFMEATGNAISFREAMESTVKATTAGLSDKQVLSIATNAKKASAALGVDMSDAISRVTRGIVKLEPELLDELGIFTKVDKAYQDYARSIGKTVSGLTDFEKRQGYATAVLKEFEDKFSSINIPTNPYDKLLASLKDIGQSTFELINKGLGPLVKILSESPVGLGMAIAGLSAVLLKQAMPAIGEVRHAYQGAAKAARDAARDRYKDMESAYKVERNLELRELDARAEAIADKYHTQTDKMLAEYHKYGTKAAGLSKKAAEIAAKAISEVTDEDLKWLNSRKGKTVEDTYSKLSAQVVEYRKSVTDLYTEESKIEAQRAKALEGFNASANTRRIYFRELSAAQSKEISSNATYIASIRGMSAGFRELKRDITEATKGPTTKKFDVTEIIDGKEVTKVVTEITPKMSKLRAASTGLAGSFGVLTGALGTALNALSPWLAAASLLIPVFLGLKSWLSSNEEEAGRFSKALDTLAESGENAKRVFDSFSKKGPLETFSSQALGAKGAALEGVANSIQEALDAYEKTVSKRSISDEATNLLANLFFSSDEQVLAKALEKNIQKALLLVNTDSMVKPEITKLLGISSDAGKGAISKAYEEADPKTQKAVAELLQKAGKAASTAAGNFKSLSDSLEEVDKQYTAVLDTFKAGTPLMKFAEGSIQQLVKEIDTISKSGVNAQLDEMAKLSSDRRFLQLLPEDAAKRVLGMSASLKQLDTEYKGYLATQLKVTEDIEKQQELIDKSYAAPGAKGTLKTLKGLVPFAGEVLVPVTNIKAATAEIERLKKVGDEATKKIDGLKPKVTAMVSSFNAEMAKGIAENINTLIKGVETAKAKAGISVKQAAIATVPTSRTSIILEGRLENQQINLQIAELEQGKSLIRAQRDLEIAILDNTATAKQSRVDELTKTLKELKSAPLAMFINRAEITKTESDLTKAKAESTAAYNVYNTANALKGSSLKQLQTQKPTDSASLEAITKLIPAAAGLAQIDAQIVAQNAQKEMGNIKTKARLVDESVNAQLKVFEKDTKDLEDRKSVFAQIAGGKTPEERASTQEAFAKEEAGITANREAAIAFGELTKTLNAADILKSKPLAKEGYRAYAEAAEVSETARGRAEGLATKTIGTTRALELLQNSEDAANRLYSAQSLVLDTEISRNTNSQALLDNENALNNLLPDEYAKKSAILKLESIRLGKSKTLLDLENTRDKELRDLEKTKISAGGEATASAATLEGWGKQKAAIMDTYNTGVAAANEFAATQSKITSMQIEATERMTGYQDIFKNGFSSMADAITEFAQTGKISFKSLINNMIADLLRFELKLQAQAMYRAAKPGITSFLSSAFPSLFVGSTSALTTGDFARMDRKAKGGAYDAGIEAFAKGGMFTNSIVSSPTLFKFAKGTGLMGEAGPEAIMPLKRDSNGNLGVRTNQNSANVDVVVNNYGNEKAEVKETTDSRGNRRIEVVVGEMTAGEVSKSSSPTQRAVGATFGLRPQLIRR